MKRRGRAGLLTAALALAVGLAGCGSAGYHAPDYDKPQDRFVFTAADTAAVYDVQPDGADAANLLSYDLVTENNLLALYVDGKTSHIAVADRRNGKVWYAVSPTAASDAGATEEMKKLMQATLGLTYYEGEATHTLDNYTGCIESGNFNIQEITGGVRVQYNLGEAGQSFDNLPKKLSDERFKTFFVDHPDLTEVDAIRINKYFEWNEGERVWEMVETNKAAVYIIADLMDRVGYTQEEMARDDAAHGLAADTSDKKYFTVAVDFTLEHESLMVSVPLSELQYNPAIPPLSITVLPNFGAVERGAQGYLFVPDGSGAVIDFPVDAGEGGSHSSPGSYDCLVYGQNRTNPVRTKPIRQMDNTLPVFGLHLRDTAGFLAVIEDSVSMAAISAVKAGALHSYNTISASFTYTDIDSVFIGDGSMQTQFKSLQKSPYQGEIRVRYLLMGKDSGYDAMAGLYRDYLAEKNDLRPLQSGPVPMQVEVTGAIDKVKTTLGFAHKGTEALTTFEQTTAMYDELLALGAQTVNLKLSGWFNGGLTQDSPAKVKVESALGGRKGLDRLLADARGKGVSIYPAVSLLTVPEGSGSFNAERDGSRTLDETIARTFRYDMVSEESTDRFTIVSPRYVGTLIERFLAQYGKNTAAKNLALTDLGSDFYADYARNATYSREVSRKIYEEQLALLADRTEALMLDSPVAALAGRAAAVVDAPLESNGYHVLTRSVPFYAIALHGYVPFSGEAYNTAADREEYLLKMAESGALPYFSFIHAGAAALKGSDYSYLMSNTFADWKADAAAVYNRLLPLLQRTGHQAIAAHRPAAGADGTELERVFVTEYADGTRVYVNYSERDVTADGLAVPARDFAWREGPTA